MAMATSLMPTTMPMSTPKSSGGSPPTQTMQTSPLHRSWSSSSSSSNLNPTHPSTAPCTVCRVPAINLQNAKHAPLAAAHVAALSVAFVRLGLVLARSLFPSTTFAPPLFASPPVRPTVLAPVCAMPSAKVPCINPLLYSDSDDKDTEDGNGTSPSGTVVGNRGYVNPLLFGDSDEDSEEESDSEGEEDDGVFLDADAEAEELSLGFGGLFIPHTPSFFCENESARNSPSSPSFRTSSASPSPTSRRRPSPSPCSPDPSPFCSPAMEDEDDEEDDMTSGFKKFEGQMHLCTLTGSARLAWSFRGALPQDACAFPIVSRVGPRIEFTPAEDDEDEDDLEH